MTSIEFEQIKKQIIPYFVKFYGKEYENIIIDRINKTVPLFYSTIDGQKLEMDGRQREKQIELTLRFLDYLKVDIPEKIKNELIAENAFYPLRELENVNNILNAYFGVGKYTPKTYNGIDTLSFTVTDDEDVISASVEKLKLLGVSISEEQFNDWVVTEEAQALSKKIEEVKEYIDTLNNEYQEFNRQFEDLKATLSKSDTIKKHINEKYIVEFLKSIQDYMTDNDKELFQKYLNSDKKYSYRLNNLHILKAVGNDFSNNGLLDAFGSEAISRLKDSSVPEFTKMCIINDRIKYYKLLGIYDEQLSPEEFMNSSVAIENAPPQSYMDEIIKKKQYYGNLANQEIFQATSTYTDVLNTIDSLNVDYNPEEIAEIISGHEKCIVPCSKMENSVPQFVPLLLFTTEGNDQKYTDVEFIHEMNHIIEFSLLEYSRDKKVYKTGFDYLDDSNTSSEKRDYELFSETINQMIAIEITEAMHKDGIYLFSNSARAKTFGGTSYEQRIPLVNEFWNHFKSDIVNARLDDNLDHLMNVVGENNFNKLNEIIKEFASMSSYKLNDKRNSLLISKDEVIKSMTEYAKLNSGYEPAQVGYSM